MRISDENKNLILLVSSMSGIKNWRSLLQNDGQILLQTVAGGKGRYAKQGIYYSVGQILQIRA